MCFTVGALATVLLHRFTRRPLLSNLVILTLLQLAQVFCSPGNNLCQLALILQYLRSPDREPEYVYCIYSGCLFFTMIGADKDLESSMTRDVR